MTNYKLWHGESWPSNMIILFCFINFYLQMLVNSWAGYYVLNCDFMTVVVVSQPARLHIIVDQMKLFLKNTRICKRISDSACFWMRSCWIKKSSMSCFVFLFDLRCSATTCFATLVFHDENISDASATLTTTDGAYLKTLRMPILSSGFGMTISCIAGGRGAYLKSAVNR